jgi:hypothetical protein
MSKRKPAPTPPPPAPAQRLLIDGVTGLTYGPGTIAGTTAEAVRVIRSVGVTLNYLTLKDAGGAGILDYGDSGLSIIEPDILRCGRAVIADSAGKDTQGSGIIIQGSGTTISGGSVIDCGNDTIFEHGIYVSRLAWQAQIIGTTLIGNAASGIKLAGGVDASGLKVSGSPRGVVLASLPSGVTAILRGSVIAGSTYAVMAEIGASLTGYSLDWNTYAAGSRFRLPSGAVVDLAGWQRATGLDAHSTLTP